MNKRSLVLFFVTSFTVVVIATILDTPPSAIAFAAIGTGLVAVLSDWQKRRRDVHRDHE